MTDQWIHSCDESNECEYQSIGGFATNHSLVFQLNVEKNHSLSQTSIVFKEFAYFWS